MGHLTYTRLELLRTLRNRRFFLFSLGFPLILYFVIAGPNRGEDDFSGTGIPVPLYYMVGLAGFGAMTAALSSGARISTERALGWNRHLRITPLTARAYLSTKVLTAYTLALVSILVLYAAGVVLGVRLPASQWIEMTALLLVGLVPFAALGILIGHLLTPDTIGPVLGGGVSLLALLGGTWFPITGGALYTIARGLPSYWLVQASRVPVGGRPWGATGWIVMAAWSVALCALAGWAYRRDTRRV